MKTETTDPIPDFPDISISDSFFNETAHLIPLSPPGDNAGRDPPGYEPIFRAWLKAVKTHYPEQCTDNFTWLTAAWILFLEYGNSIWNSPISGTEYRKGVMWWLVSRFREGFQRVVKA